MFQLFLMFHLIGDFVVQNDADVVMRNEKPFIGNVLHVLKTYCAYIILLIIFWLIANVGDFELFTSFILRLGVLSFMHLLIDLSKTYFVKYKAKIPYINKINSEKFNIWMLILDQVMHVLSIVILFDLFIIQDILTIDLYIIIMINSVLLATFFGHELIKLILNFILKEYVMDNNFKSAKFIGILERILITPTIILGVYEVLIVILGLKVFSDFKQKETKIINRNAFIIGNLLSLLMVFVGVIFYYVSMSL